MAPMIAGCATPSKPPHDAWIDIAYTVTTDGKVRDPKIVDRWSGAPLSDDRWARIETDTFDAMKAWRFQPSRKGGRAVEAATSVRLFFQADKAGVLKPIGNR